MLQGRHSLTAHGQAAPRALGGGAHPGARHTAGWRPGQRGAAHVAGRQPPVQVAQVQKVARLAGHRQRVRREAQRQPRPRGQREPGQARRARRRQRRARRAQRREQRQLAGQLGARARVADARAVAAQDVVPGRGARASLCSQRRGAAPPAPASSAQRSHWQPRPCKPAGTLSCSAPCAVCTMPFAWQPRWRAPLRPACLRGHVTRQSCKAGSAEPGGECARPGAGRAGRARSSGRCTRG